MGSSPLTLPAIVTVDASVAVKWTAITEERADQAGALLQMHLNREIRIEVLPLTPYEVGNATLSRGGFELARDALAALRGLALTIPDTTIEVDLEAASLAGRYGLSFYDASYLASAIARNAPLVTDDMALLDAARAEGVGIALADVPVEVAT